MTHKQQTGKYLLAVSLVAVATVLRLAMGHFLGTTAPFLTFYPTVILVVLMCGLGPAIVTVVLSGLIVDFLFLPAYLFHSRSNPMEMLPPSFSFSWPGYFSPS